MQAAAGRAGTHAGHDRSGSTAPATGAPALRMPALRTAFRLNPTLAAAVAVGQAGDQRTFEHAARQRRATAHPGFTSDCWLAAMLAQPAQQRLRGLHPHRSGWSMRQARQARRVLGALGVAAQPEQVLGGAAGDQALALRQSTARRAPGPAAWCVSTSPSVSTQVSALLPPRCMVAISAFAGGATRSGRRAAPASPAAVGQREHAQHHRAGHVMPALAAAPAARWASAPAAGRPARCARRHDAHDAAGPFVELAGGSGRGPAPARSCPLPAPW
jgi:hypothetical protein